MTDIEDLFARDIAAVTGGVVVTESDLREARNAVHQAIERSRKRDRLRHATVAAAAAVVLAAVGAAVFLAVSGDDESTQLADPGADLPDPYADYLVGSPPTAELIGGVWRVDNGHTLVKLDEIGTISFDDHGTLFSDPITTGTYALDGDVITVTITDDDEAGCIGEKVALRAASPEAGALRFVRPDTSAACSPLAPGRGVLEQVLPTSRSVAELVFSADQGWQPLTDASRLHGVWLAEGGGHVLELGPGGVYFVADGSGEPVDLGQWSLRNATLTLTSTADSPGCKQSSQLVLGSVEWVDPGTTAIRGTLSKNTCGGAWTPAAWILIPHVNR